jgi:hypothetical protein
LIKRLAEYQVTTDPQFYTLYGDFANGTARQVSISPTSDHFIEPMDPWIIRQLLRWHASAFERPKLAQNDLPAWRRATGKFLIILTITVIYAWGMVRVCSYPSVMAWSARQPQWVKLRIHVLPLSIFLILLWWAGNAIQMLRPFIPHFMTSFVAAHLFISVWVHQMARTRQRQSEHPLHAPGIVLFNLVLAFFLTCLLVNLSFFARFPGALVWYPLFVLNMLLLFPLQLWLRVIAALFTGTTTACSPNVWYWIILLGTVIVLDWPIRLLNRMAERCIVVCQKEFRWYDTSFSTLKWIGFAIVWGVFGVLAYRRLAEGMLTAETVQAGLGLLLRLILLPGSIFWLLVRHRHKI